MVIIIITLIDIDKRGRASVEADWFLFAPFCPPDYLHQEILYRFGWQRQRIILHLRHQMNFPSVDNQCLDQMTIAAMISMISMISMIMISSPDVSPQRISPPRCAAHCAARWRSHLEQPACRDDDNVSNDDDDDDDDGDDDDDDYDDGNNDHLCPTLEGCWRSRGSGSLISVRRTDHSWLLWSWLAWWCASRKPS